MSPRTMRSARSSPSRRVAVPSSSSRPTRVLEADEHITKRDDMKSQSGNPRMSPVC